MSADTFFGLESIPNITVADDGTLAASLNHAIYLAEALHGVISSDSIGGDSGAARQAARTSLLAVNAVMAAMSARCTMYPPPPVDIEMITDSSGKLILRCHHATPHKWDLNGNVI